MNEDAIRAEMRAGLMRLLDVNKVDGAQAKLDAIRALCDNDDQLVVDDWGNTGVRIHALLDILDGEA